MCVVKLRACNFHVALDEVNSKRVLRQLSKLQILSTGGEDLAIASAQNYRVLRSRGITVRRTIDCLIVTFCMREGHTLLHCDRGFDPFEEHLRLYVVHPQLR